MSAPLSIVLLVDNETSTGLVAEHGFAAWIDTDDECFLFDTGQGAALEHNARALGADLSAATALILSHGHYDHTGGLPTFLAANRQAPILYGKGATQARFSCHPEQTPRAIGMTDVVLAELERLPAERRIELEEPRFLRSGIGITGPVPRITDFEDTGGPFFRDAERVEADLIQDDLSLWFETTEGLVILTGCCHSGLVNTVRHIRSISGVERIHGIIGGLHLLNANDERLRATQQFLADCQPDFLVPCHCTGSHVAEQFQQRFGKNIVTAGGAGRRIDVGALRAQR